MREIKFRGYDKIADAWVFGMPVKDSVVKGRVWMMFDESGGAIVDDPKTIGECLFVNSKGGNYIYEGDIIKCGKIIGIVEKRPFGWYMKYMNASQTSNYNSNGMTLNAVYLYEVIGNIHENPEPLK